MASRNRKSFLDFEPIKYSLTEGTNIPPPPESPPPTAGKDAVNGTHVNGEALSEETKDRQQERPDELRSPSIMSKQTSPRPHGVRRLFSLSSLRSSFSGSRSSLALPRESVDFRPQQQPEQHSEQQVQDENRPPALTSTSYPAPNSALPPRPQSRAMSIRSTRWFGKRKSGLWMLNGENHLASIGEDGRPDSKRIRDRSPPPTLPEVDDEDLNGGEIGWDDKLFRN